MEFYFVKDFKINTDGFSFWAQYIFYGIFLIMYIQWRALKGIKVLTSKNHKFVCSPLLKERGSALDSDKPKQLQAAIEKIERDLSITR